MSYSTYHKSINAQLHSDYLIENKFTSINQYQTPKKDKNHLYKKRKISQASTLSFRSKNKKYESAQKKINSMSTNKIKAQNKNDNKNTKRKEKQPSTVEQLKFTIEKNRNLKNTNYNYVLTKRKQPLKLQKLRKSQNKTQIALTSRYIKGNVDSFTQKNTKHIRKSSDNSNMKSMRNQSYTNKKQTKNIKPMPILKIRDKNLQVMLNRCEKVMTQYFQHINQLQKQNQCLKLQNIKLKNSPIIIIDSQFITD